MERRVIKINLVGAICVLILIIAAIVGIIVFAVSRNKGGNTKKDENHQEEIQQINENKEADNKEQIEIEGQAQEIAMKNYESSLRYKINYATDNFYIDENLKDKDVFKSLESDTVYIEIEKIEDGFVDKSRELITSEANKRKEDSTYRMETVDLNGRLCYIESYLKDEDVCMNYFIEKEQSYYHARVHIGKEFINTNQPIIEKMMSSFRTI